MTDDRLVRSFQIELVHAGAVGADIAIVVVIACPGTPDGISAVLEVAVEAPDGVALVKVEIGIVDEFSLFTGVDVDGISVEVNIDSEVERTVSTIVVEAPDDVEIPVRVEISIVDVTTATEFSLFTGVDVDGISVELNVDSKVERIVSTIVVEAPDDVEISVKVEIGTVEIDTDTGSLVANTPAPVPTDVERVVWVALEAAQLIEPVCMNEIWSASSEPPVISAWTHIGAG
ncbi:hypothetical protein G7Y89_g10778 [Cudoniella acicularis]|uniref:Uncharacterized protein n=1 Tax=Cudoniella acicularis TaxID=354080 RepID=A0A8H4RC43_9HELO|nr:hypothetical protein G7Y89_g10778 [Cudoniella acicularis]